MSSSETSLTYQQWRDLLQQRKDITDVLPLMARSDGTHVLVRYSKAGQVQYAPYVLSDLTLPIGLQLIANDETVYTDTASASPAKTLSIPANNYRLIMLEAEVELDGGGNETDSINISFKPTNAASIFHLKTVGHVAADTNILSTRCSTIYGPKKTAHTAEVDIGVVTIGLNGAYFVRPFRAWGIP